MNITKNLEAKQPIIDSLLSIPGLLRASDLELKPRREEIPVGSTPQRELRGHVIVHRLSANDELYQDTPQNRVRKIQKLIRTPVVSAALTSVLEVEAIYANIASRQTQPSRSWAAILHDAARRVVTGGRLSEHEADLVRLGVVLTGLQQLIKESNGGEDDDWVYRASKAARAHLMALDPDASLWLQNALGHGLPEEDLTDKARYMNSLMRRAAYFVTGAGCGR